MINDIQKLQELFEERIKKELDEAFVSTSCLKLTKIIEYSLVTIELLIEAIPPELRPLFLDGAILSLTKLKQKE